MAGTTGVGARKTSRTALLPWSTDEVITFKDLQDYIRQTYASMAAQGVPEDRVKEMMAELAEQRPQATHHRRQVDL